MKDIRLKINENKLSLQDKAWDAVFNYADKRELYSIKAFGFSDSRYTVFVSMLCDLIQTEVW